MTKQLSKPQVRAIEKEAHKTLYQQLIEAVEKLPKEAVEEAKKEITRRGYDTTGYQYQFLVNVLNEVVGLGNWGESYEITREAEGQWSNGKSYHDITADVTVWIEVKEGKKAQFTMPGGHKSDTHADAKKGAITNGFKKALAMFGVGKKAYEGTLDEDYRPQGKKQEPARQEKKKDDQPFITVTDIKKELYARGFDTEQKALEGLNYLTGYNWTSFSHHTMAEVDEVYSTLKSVK